jgi:hypothetical protein
MNSDGVWLANAAYFARTAAFPGVSSIFIVRGLAKVLTQGLRDVDSKPGPGVGPRMSSPELNVARAGESKHVTRPLTASAASAIAN